MFHKKSISGSVTWWQNVNFLVNYSFNNAVRLSEKWLWKNVHPCSFQMEISFLCKRYFESIHNAFESRDVLRRPCVCGTSFTWWFISRNPFFIQSQNTLLSTWSLALLFECLQGDLKKTNGTWRSSEDERGNSSALVARVPLWFLIMTNAVISIQVQEEQVLFIPAGL